MWECGCRCNEADACDGLNAGVGLDTGVKVSSGVGVSVLVLHGCGTMSKSVASKKGALVRLCVQGCR